MLLPRVALTSASTALPVVNPNTGVLVAGTLVWNTATAGSYPNNVKPGYYYWSGTKWISVVTSNTINLGLHSNSTSTVEPLVAGLSGNSNTGSNTVAGSVDNATLTKTISITGAVGNITNVSCNVKFNALETLTDVFLYLKSPTGQIINLKFTETGSYDTLTTASLPFDVTYSDAGLPMPMSVYNSNTGITGTYAPYGDMAISNNSLPNVTPTISTMSGFNGVSPNGTWTLYFKDEFGTIVSNYTSFSLNITTGISAQYRLVGESEITNLNGNKILTNATYSANTVNDYGFITALTETTTSAGAIGTTVTTLPGTVLSYSSDSPKVGAGNYWASTSNLGVSTSPTNGVTYFYQLWVKGGIDSPTLDNEKFYIAPQQMP